MLKFLFNLLFQPTFIVEVQCYDSDGSALRPLFKKDSGWHLPRVGESYIVPYGIAAATVKAVRHNRFGRKTVVEVVCSTEYERDQFIEAGWGKLASAT
jgi:hypothetical protein